LVNSTYQDTNLTVDDSCAFCAAPIAVTCRAGTVALVQPRAAYLLGGGT
jgi:hypothetical protein